MEMDHKALMQGWGWTADSTNDLWTHRIHGGGVVALSGHAVFLAMDEQHLYNISSAALDKGYADIETAKYVQQTPTAQAMERFGWTERFGVWYQPSTGRGLQQSEVELALAAGNQAFIDLITGTIKEAPEVPDDSPLVDLGTLKRTFWAKVICCNGIDESVKRFVGRAPSLEDSNKGRAGHIELFVPKTCDDDFNLVTSLCTDGNQRLTVDWDHPNVPPNEYVANHRVGFILPSTSNWHLYGNDPIGFDELMKKQQATNHGYLQMNKPKGYCTLRPPWIGKDYDVAGPMLRQEGRYKGLKEFFDQYRTEPQAPGESWDDLFADDEDGDGM